MSSSSRRRAAQRGFTLPELLIGIGLAGLVIAVIGSLSLYSGVNFACLINYTEMDSASLNAMNRLTRDIRSANGASAISTNSITLRTDTGSPLTYSYSGNTRTLSRIDGTNTSVILRECDQLQFFVYQRTPIEGQFAQYEIGDTNESKVVFVTWTCSRTVFGRKLTTDSASAGRVVMRVN